MRIEIEQLMIPTEKDSLFRWKERDPAIVPEFALAWKGNGVANGYGFGEWMAERYFRSLGYYVINNEFDLFSKTSKYKRYNDLIKMMVGNDKYESFSQKGKTLYDQGYKIENLDLFVFNTHSCFFAEVKKGKDFLREPQLRFMYLADRLLGVPCKEVYVSEEEPNVLKKFVTYEIS
ncbi:hypothetical protein [Neobacillus dielmonensis]|uniref:hypothetical protein n=1 Tax=Neobacillus dielmonensis TaxID=1347369 RepID=UPI0005AB14CD|nr:hypothetical protein [Neobacillus dielmonensis]